MQVFPLRTFAENSEVSEDGWAARKRGPAFLYILSVNQQRWRMEAVMDVLCVRFWPWSGQTLTGCTHTLRLLVSPPNTVISHTHTPAWEAAAPALVTQSAVTGHSGRWLTPVDLFIFLPWPIITHTKYHLLASALYSGNNTSLMSRQTHVLLHRALGGRWNDVRSAGVVTEPPGKKNGFCLMIN